MQAAAGSQMAAVVCAVRSRGYKARSRETGGSGLGLSIVRHVATNHGGEVLVSSQEGEGSTFVLRLPASLVVDRPESRGAAPLTASLTAPPVESDAFQPDEQGHR